MIPKIETINEKKLVGKRMKMCYADYRIGELWGSFMPRRKEITKTLTNDLISLVVYASNHFIDFKPTNEFERWATVEVENFNKVPDEMETYNLSSGLYAVFNYKGRRQVATVNQVGNRRFLVEWLENGVKKFRLINIHANFVGKYIFDFVFK